MASSATVSALASPNTAKPPGGYQQYSYLLHILTLHSLSLCMNRSHLLLLHRLHYTCVYYLSINASITATSPTAGLIVPPWHVSWIRNCLLASEVASVGATRSAPGPGAPGQGTHGRDDLGRVPTGAGGMTIFVPMTVFPWGDSILAHYFACTFVVGYIPIHSAQEHSIDHCHTTTQRKAEIFPSKPTFYQLPVLKLHFIKWLGDWCWHRKDHNIRRCKRYELEESEHAISKNIFSRGILIPGIENFQLIC